MTSLTQTAGHKMAALTVLYSRLSNGVLLLFLSCSVVLTNGTSVSLTKLASVSHVTLGENQPPIKRSDRTGERASERLGMNTVTETPTITVTWHEHSNKDPNDNCHLA